MNVHDLADRAIVYDAGPEPCQGGYIVREDCRSSKSRMKIWKIETNVWCIAAGGLRMNSRGGFTGKPKYFEDPVAAFKWLWKWKDRMRAKAKQNGLLEWEDPE